MTRRRAAAGPPGDARRREVGPLWEAVLPWTALAVAAMVAAAFVRQERSAGTG